MTSREAREQIATAIDSLKAVRNALGAQLSLNGFQPDANDHELRNQRDLHDRAAAAITAYHKEL